MKRRTVIIKITKKKRLFDAVKEISIFFSKKKPPKNWTACVMKILFNLLHCKFAVFNARVQLNTFSISCHFHGAHR